MELAISLTRLDRATYSDVGDTGSGSMTLQPSDRVLVDAVITGDHEAYRVLVEREKDNVIGLCRRVLRDPELAEDVAQEAFIQAYRALPTFRGDGAFGAWVGRIASRMAYAQLKRPAELRADPTREDGWLVDAGDGIDPQRLLLDGERRAEVQQAIAALPEHQRRIVEMRYYGGLSLEEISSATGAPLGTVKSRLHRALSAMRERLGR